VTKAVSVLPDSLPPRGLSRVQAAEYVGVGVTKFDEMVADARMPRPKRIDGRTVWDRVQLDKAFAALPGDDDERNPFDDLFPNRKRQGVI
jgi:predicted DNA-binding transcriptional regulator AlpA